MNNSVFNNGRHLWAYRLKKLEEKYPEDEKYPTLIKVVEKGYDYFYTEVKYTLASYEDVSQLPELETGVGEATCDLVVDILGLYKELYCAQSKHGKGEIPDDLIAFRGFDLETENKHFHFCCFMLENACKIHSQYEYKGITSNPFFRDNSHCGIVPYYKKMLERSENIPHAKLSRNGTPSYLSPDDVRRVVGLNH